MSRTNELKALRNLLMDDIAELIKQQYIKINCNEGETIDWDANDNIVTISEEELGETIYVGVMVAETYDEVTHIITAPINLFYLTNSGEVTINYGEDDAEVDLSEINTDNLASLWESLKKLE